MTLGQALQFKYIFRPMIKVKNAQFISVHVASDDNSVYFIDVLTNKKLNLTKESMAATDWIGFENIDNLTWNDLLKAVFHSEFNKTLTTQLEVSDDGSRL